MQVTFEQMWTDLAPVGRSATTGGYSRQPFTTAEREAHAWFLEECARRDLRVERDGFGNVVAWWDGEPQDDPVTPPPAPRGAVLTGSHLDSVREGGAYDGPLGVVSALAAVDVLRDRGFVPTRPLGIGVFAEEEGSRFPLACLGSRLATGRLDWASARELRDRDGVALGDVVEAARRCSWTTWASTSSCTSSRDVTSSTAVRRSGSPRPSGRTGATASTSQDGQTTPGPRAWRTGTTRC